MLTVAAICLGLTAIKLGFQGSHERAGQLILLACVLDGLDGRVARLLNSDSKMGAELDSLADFLNFGVAPPMVLYFWALQDMPRLGWISVQIFAVCCVIRLARFNVTSKSDLEVDNSGYFVGVPAPAGALLVMLPMFLSFAMDDAELLPTLVICAHMVAIGLLKGDLVAEDYEDDVASDPRVDGLRDRMEVIEDARYSTEYHDPDKRSIANAMQVFFKDGS